MQKYYKIAIIGLGSIGTRHLYNIIHVLKERETKFMIDIIRSNTSKEINHEIQLLINKVYYSMNDVPFDYDVVFITNPTHLHLETITKFSERTRHMFIEKPVFDKVDVSINDIPQKEDSIYYVACPLRYTNVIQHLKKHIKHYQVYCARVICSSYLPEWRSNVDYRTTYSAYQSKGGGVSLDLIHEWDYLHYLFGQPQQVFNLKGKFSNLEIDSDDLSLYIAKYPKMVVEVHLDYFGRKSIREIQLFTDQDTIVADLANSEVRFLQKEETISFREQRDDFQQKEISYFFDVLEGKEENTNDLWTALQTLRTAKGLNN